MKTTEIKTTMETTNVYKVFLNFKKMLSDYFIKNYNADLEIGRIAFKLAAMDKIHQTLFMIYVFEYWNAYAMDIINGKYNYVNLTELVYNSWLEHMAR